MVNGYHILWVSVGDYDEVNELSNEREKGIESGVEL
jgi:hypothetical protein